MVSIEWKWHFSKAFEVFRGKDMEQRVMDSSFIDEKLQEVHFSFPPLAMLQRGSTTIAGNMSAFVPPLSIANTLTSREGLLSDAGPCR